MEGTTTAILQKWQESSWTLKLNQNPNDGKAERWKTGCSYHHWTELTNLQTSQLQTSCFVLFNNFELADWFFAIKSILILTDSMIWRIKVGETMQGLKSTWRQEPGR